jgi:alpha-methylacyl-CoA racemase
MTMVHGYRQAGIWNLARGTNTVDGGSPYYATYATSDGKFMAVGAVEKRFYRLLIEGLGLASADLPEQDDMSRWDELRAIFAERFATRTRDEWTMVFGDSDACVTPVLDMDECVSHPMAVDRGLFETHDGVVNPAPAPRFSRTAATIRHGTIDPAKGTRDALLAWGVSAEAIDDLAAKGVIAMP